VDEGIRPGGAKELSLRVLVVFSAVDEAGKNIANSLREEEEKEEEEEEKGEEEGRGFDLIEVRKDLIELSPGDLPEADYVIFASKHVGQRPSFTVHVSGNPGRAAPFGGSPFSVSAAAPRLMLACLERMRELSPPGFEVTYEVTHHGPTFLKRPSFFAELGSGAEQWERPDYGRVVAQGILAAVDLVRSGRAESGSPVALGLGGPHYAPNITKYALSNHVAVGHIVQGSILEEEDVEKVVKIALEGNGPTDFALLDWKGVKGGTRAKVLSVAEGLGLKVIKARAALLIARMYSEALHQAERVPRFPVPG